MCYSVGHQKTKQETIKTLQVEVVQHLKEKNIPEDVIIKILTNYIRLAPTIMKQKCSLLLWNSTVTVLKKNYVVSDEKAME